MAETFDKKIPAINCRPRNAIGSAVHSVAFMADDWTAAAARRWLKQHDLKPIKHVDRTANTLRYRIRPPYWFKSFSTKKIQDHEKTKAREINLIIGYF